VEDNLNRDDLRLRAIQGGPPDGPVADRHEAIYALSGEDDEAVVLAVLEVATQLDRIAKTLEALERHLP
jgi:hypothetical protein